MMQPGLREIKQLTEELNEVVGNSSCSTEMAMDALILCITIGAAMATDSPTSFRNVLDVIARKLTGPMTAHADFWEDTKRCFGPKQQTH